MAIVKEFTMWKGAIVSLILPEYLSKCDLESLRPEARIYYFKEKIIATGVASENWSFLAVLYTANNRWVYAYMVAMIQTFV